MKLYIRILTNINGWITMNNRKKGYTLIEVIVVIAILMILGGITITLSYETIENYIININKSYYEDKFDNALLNIDTIVNSNGIVSIEQNKNFTGKFNGDIISDNLVVTFKEENNNLTTKIIYLKNEKLMVKTLNYEDEILFVGDNVLLNNIKTFSVRKKENLIYYYIESKDSGIRGRCI